MGWNEGVTDGMGWDLIRGETDGMGERLMGWEGKRWEGNVL